jgi:hypothetical protein
MDFPAVVTTSTTNSFKGKKMPIVSKAQKGWMFANKPEMAKRWAKETPNINQLPARIKPKKKRKKKKGEPK